MSNTFIFHGHLEIEFDTLKSILAPLFDNSKLTYRHASDIQQEIKFNDDTTELYIYEDFEQGFLFQVEMKGTASDAQNFIDPIAAELINNNVEFQFQWNEYDNDGNQIGEESEIKHPSDSQPLA